MASPALYIIDASFRRTGSVDDDGALRLRALRAEVFLRWARRRHSGIFGRAFSLMRAARHDFRPRVYARRRLLLRVRPGISGI